MAFADVVTKNIRLIILCELKDTNGYSSNDSVLQIVLEKWGQPLSRDRVRTELSWLTDQQLITSVPLSESGAKRVTLTELGLDVARGAASNDGVQRPSPGRGLN